MGLVVVDVDPPRADLPASAVDHDALLELLGLAPWQWRVARRRGLLHDADIEDTWSPGLVVTLLGEVDAVRTLVGTQWPVGLEKTAYRLLERTGAAVTMGDVEELVARGLLVSCDTFHGRKKAFPLYAAVDVDEIDQVVVEQVVADRVDWAAASVADKWAAAEHLG
ncbi:MAG: hypothetical protein ABIQ18_26550 [Umezawaea sp.]